MSETEFANANAPINGDDEPTMEEILSSIRRIISDDDQMAQTAIEEDEAETSVVEESEMDMAAAMQSEVDESDEDILELTEILAEDDDEDESDGFDEEVELISPDEVDDLEFSTPEPAKPEPEPVVEPIESNVEDELPDISVSETLISNQVGEQVNQNFNLLANTMLAQNGAGQTVESMVMSLMRPMLKSWLDENLPVMVEKIIREEIERVARGGKI